MKFLNAGRSMLWMKIIWLTPLAFAHLPVPIAWGQAPDRSGLDLICPLVEHERQRALEDHELDLELVENEYQSRRKVFDMVEKLWTARSIEREVYLDYKRLRDRTRVRVDRLRAQIARQKSIVEQYELTCGQVRGDATVGEIEERINSLQSRYRQLDCELLGKDVEIAEIDYEYDAEILRATRTLVESNINTKFDLVLEEYDLSQSKARVEGYRHRAAACKAELAN